MTTELSVPGVPSLDALKSRLLDPFITVELHSAVAIVFHLFISRNSAIASRKCLKRFRHARQV